MILRKRVCLQEKAKAQLQQQGEPTRSFPERAAGPSGLRLAMMMGTSPRGLPSPPATLIPSEPLKSCSSCTVLKWLASSLWPGHTDTKVTLQQCKTVPSLTQRSHYSSVKQFSRWPGHTDTKVTLQQCKTADCDMHTESKLTWQLSWGKGKAGVNCKHQSFKCSQLNGGGKIIIWCSCWVVLITVIPDLTCYRKHASSPILVIPPSPHPSHTHLNNHPTINK